MPLLKQPTIGDLIREMRRRTGMTQEELAVKIGVSFTSVNRWENNRQEPLPLAMRRIEEILEEMGDRGADLLDRYFPVGPEDRSP